MTVSDIRRTIQAAVDESPVVDTHEHLRPIEFVRGELRDGVVGLLRNTYLSRSLRASDGSPNGLSPSYEPFLASNTWETIAHVIERTRFSGYYRWLMRAFVDLYGVTGPDLTPDSWEYLSAELPKRYANDGWLSDGLTASRIQHVIWDPYWKQGTWTVPDARCRPSFRIDSSLAAFHPLASDFGDGNLIRDWATGFNLEIRSLTDLEELIERLIARNVEAGARSFKMAIAYDRSLAVDSARRSVAAGIFGKRAEALRPDQRKQFGDYIVRFFLDQARRRGLVVQMHTGLARLAGSNPLLLEPILQEYPQVVFDLFHGGYPWIHEVAALAHNYHNVRLNLAWLPHLSADLAASALKEWLQIVPQVDRITWGGDCMVVEELYGSLLAAKYSVVRALTELVEEDYWDLGTALLAAQSILITGAERIYGLEAAA